MKKSLLLAAAALLATSAFADDYYVVGNNVNGVTWTNADPSGKMDDKGNGVYEWNGSVLGNSFKINNGTWDEGAPNFGNNGSRISLGTPYTYAQGGDNIMFNGFGDVTNPKIVLDVNAGTITLTGTAEAVDPGDITYYIIGSNVNGVSWEDGLGMEDGKFVPQGNGIYRWEGQHLGTGFKINDGTWSGDVNIGSAGDKISMNTPFSYWNNGNSADIGFAGFTDLENPVLELNINDETLTIVSGEASGKDQWFFTGIDGIFELNENTVLTEVEGQPGVYSRVTYVTETSATCKVSSTGWATKYGTNDPEVFIDADNMTIYLEEVTGDGGNIPYELAEGNYIVTFDSNELMLILEAAGAGVDTVVPAEDTTVVYYNLQGQKVNNPDKGIFVKVANGKALKVVK